MPPNVLQFEQTLRCAAQRLTDIDVCCDYDARRSHLDDSDGQPGFEYGTEQSESRHLICFCSFTCIDFGVLLIIVLLQMLFGRRVSRVPYHIDRPHFAIKEQDGTTQLATKSSSCETVVVRICSTAR